MWRFFKGVPYAKPPVGNLRFAPPEPPDPWKEDRECFTFGNCAIQEPSLLVNTTPSEDCLYLNLWVPTNLEGKKAPVFFWIHGGGYYNGCGTMNYYDGTAFAQKGIIVVTINYRLGVLGFLGLKTLYDEFGTTGNWGTLDQIAALKWTKENIAAFGGDPEAITIAGESAGSFSVSNLVLSPLTKGLFKQAIMQSGSVFENFAAVPYTQSMLKPTMDMSAAFAQSLGAEDTPEGLAKLRQMDALDLWKAGFFSSDVTVSCPFAFWATLDGTVIPENPVDALMTGRYNPCNVLMGFNQNEGIVFMSDQSTEDGARDYINRIFSETSAKEVRNYYKEQGLTDMQCIPDLVTYTYFKAGMTFFKETLARQGAAVYGYEFDFTGDGNYPMQQLGAHHALDILYVFDTIETAGLTAGDAGEFVENQMHDLWCNFVKTGNPNEGDPLPDPTLWEKYKDTDPKTYYISDKVHFGPTEDMGKIRFFQNLSPGPLTVYVGD